jgi:hypothetical protein
VQGERKLYRAIFEERDGIKIKFKIIFVYNVWTMTTITIDIPDDHTSEIIAQLKKQGVKVRESKLSILDKLTKEDYQKHFSNQAKANKNNLLKYL